MHWEDVDGPSISISNVLWIIEHCDLDENAKQLPQHNRIESNIYIVNLWYPAAVCEVYPKYEMCSNHLHIPGTLSNDTQFPSNSNVMVTNRLLVSSFGEKALIIYNNPADDITIDSTKSMKIRFFSASFCSPYIQYAIVPIIHKASIYIRIILQSIHPIYKASI